MVGGWWVVVRGGGWWCAVVGGIQTALEQHQHSSQTVLKQHPSSTQTALKQPPNNTKHPDSVTQHPNSTQTAPKQHSAPKQHQNTLPGPTCCPVGGGGGLLRLVGRVGWWVVGGGWPAAGCWLLVVGCWWLAAGTQKCPSRGLPKYSFSTSFLASGPIHAFGVKPASSRGGKT